MPDINDIVQLRIAAHCNGDPVVNDLGFSLLSAYATFELAADDLASQVDAAIGVLGSAGSYIETRSVNYTIDAVQVQDVLPGTAPMFSRTSGAVGGIDTEDSLPANDSLCITWRSAFKGQGNRGRIYLTGWPEGAQQNGYWVADAQTQAQVVAESLLASFGEEGTSSNFRLVVIHRTSNGGVRGAPVVKLDPPEQKPVMGFTIHNEVRSLGRRSTGRRVRRTRTA